MFQVNDIWDEAMQIFSFCDEAKGLKWLSDAVTLTANKGDFEGWKGYLDICSTGQGRCVTMPREVETVYAVLIDKNPSVPYGQLFNFHLNGLGENCSPCNWSWQDMGGAYSTYRDLPAPSKLVAYVSNPEDTGSKLIVHGFDDRGNRLKRETSEGQLDGYQVPTIYGYAVTDAGAPTIGRIDYVEKGITKGPVRLSTIDNGNGTGVLLAVYEPDEVMPQYRRIRLGKSANWLRIAYRRSTPLFTSKYDRVPLKSRIGFLLACKARKMYSEDRLNEAHAYEADAARLEIEAQLATETPAANPIQVENRQGLVDKSDVDIR